MVGGRNTLGLGSWNCKFCYYAFVVPSYDKSYEKNDFRRVKKLFRKFFYTIKGRKRPEIKGFQNCVKKSQKNFKKGVDIGKILLYYKQAVA